MIRGGYWGGAWGLSWAGTWGEAWLLLNQPYQELSLKGQVFVRSYLTRIHSVEVAEQIVAVAALNNISVIDAEVVVAAKTGEARLESATTATSDVVVNAKQTTAAAGTKQKTIARMADPVSIDAVSSEAKVQEVWRSGLVTAKQAQQTIYAVSSEVSVIQTLT